VGDARRHDRDEPAAGLEERRGMHDVPDVLLIGEGRIHHDAVEQPFRAEQMTTGDPGRQEVQAKRLNMRVHVPKTAT
jgi:hypothetical protein